MAVGLGRRLTLSYVFRFLPPRRLGFSSHRSGTRSWASCLSGSSSPQGLASTVVLVEMDKGFTCFSTILLVDAAPWLSLGLAGGDLSATLTLFPHCRTRMSWAT